MTTQYCTAPFYMLQNHSYFWRDNRRYCIILISYFWILKKLFSKVLHHEEKQEKQST